MIEIYRLENSGDSYTNLAATKKVILSGATDNGVSYITTKITMSRTQTNNPAPLQEEARHPDVGFSGIRYIISVYFEPVTAATVIVTRLRDWFASSNKTRGANPLPNGRFGYHDDDNPEFDVHPVRTSGLKLTTFDIDFVGHPSERRATIILEHSGQAEHIGNSGDR